VKLEKILTVKSFKRWTEKNHYGLSMEATWPRYFERKSHPRGEASDIEIMGVPNIDVAYWIKDNIKEFDQLILEFYNPADPQGGWVHVSYSKDNNRNQLLTISKGGTEYGLPDRHV